MCIRDSILTIHLLFSMIFLTFSWQLLLLLNLVLFQVIPHFPRVHLHLLEYIPHLFQALFKYLLLRPFPRRYLFQLSLDRRSQCGLIQLDPDMFIGLDQVESDLRGLEVMLLLLRVAPLLRCLDVLVDRRIRAYPVQVHLPDQVGLTQQLRGDSLALLDL